MESLCCVPETRQYYNSTILQFQVFPDRSVGKESACDEGDHGSIYWVGKIRWRRDRLPTPVFLDFPCGAAGKECTYNVEDLGSIPGLGGSPGEGKDYPVQYSGLENSIDCIVHGVGKSQTQLGDFQYFSFKKDNIKIKKK